MTSAEQQRFRRLRVLCEELETLDEMNREERLEALETTEPGLFPELRHLLENVPDSQASGFDALAGAASELLDSTGAPEDQPTRIDRYELLRPIGEGGMGEVWAAQQSEPVSRIVAVKILRAGYASPERVARFEIERQALATMDHPNIASVFDGGETEQGQPYFVMELVDDGVPITTYCTRERLSLQERLRLFVPVCEAIDHAHRKRIIHRDLKPSNVLVTEDNGKSLVKVIDFGIAKPLEEQWASDSAATVLGELVGTPEYMSPEQAALGAVDIDTRSDVYALGLMLFEMVVGELPHSSAQLRSLPFDELCRHLREVEAPAASARLRARTREEAFSIGGAGTADWRQVKGDLDRIVAKALAKDRELRYGSAAELAEDLRRFLAHEPVRATPPSRRYRIAKFVRRHRTAVAAGLLLFVGLVTGLAVAIYGLREARAAEQRTRQSLAALKSSERFLVDLFREANPENNPGEDPTASEILERGIERLSQLDDQPRVQGRLLWNLGEVQNVRGSYEEAESLLRRAVERLAADDEDRFELASAKSRLASVLRRQSQLEEAEIQARGAVDLLAGEEGVEAKELLGSALTLVALIASNSGRHDEAEQTYRQLLPLLEELDQPDSTRYPIAQFNRAVNLSFAGDTRAALEALQDPLETLVERLPANHPNIGTLHHTMGTWNEEIGQLHCAVAHEQRALEIYREALPAGHSHIGDALNGLGIALLKLGRSAEAKQALEDADALYLAAHGPDSWRRVAALGHLGEVALYEREYQRAAQFFESKVRVLREMPDNERRRETLAVTLRLQAIAHRLQALELESKKGLEEAAASLSKAHTALGEQGPARERAALALQTALLEAQSGDFASARARLAEAETLVSESSQLDRPATFQFRAQLFALLGDDEAARTSLVEAVSGDKRALWLLEAPEIGRLDSGWLSARRAELVAAADSGRCDLEFAAASSSPPATSMSRP